MPVTPSVLVCSAGCDSVSMFQHRGYLKLHPVPPMCSLLAPTHTWYALHCGAPAPCVLACLAPQVATSGHMPCVRACLAPHVRASVAGIIDDVFALGLNKDNRSPNSNPTPPLTLSRLVVHSSHSMDVSTSSFLISLLLLHSLLSTLQSPSCSHRVNLPKPNSNP